SCRQPVGPRITTRARRCQIGRLTALSLIVLVEAELVALARLPGHSTAVDVLAVGVAILDRGVRHVRPRACVAGGRVRLAAGNVLRLAEPARGREEPELVLLDRSAERDARVVVVVNRRRILNAERTQRVVEVAPLRPRAGDAAERFAFEYVAAGL